MSTDKFVRSEISGIIELCTDSCGNTKKSQERPFLKEKR